MKKPLFPILCACLHLLLRKIVWSIKNIFCQSYPPHLRSGYLITKRPAGRGFINYTADNSCSGFGFIQWTYNYLINYRLKEAVILLLNTEKQIHVISNETGFNNVDYFCRIFKKRYHLTPSEYRKEKFIISTISS